MKILLNLVSNFKHVDLRAAASLLKSTFLNKQEFTHKREIPNLLLNYDSCFAERLIKPEIVSEYEVGFETQRSIVAGRIWSHLSGVN